MITCVVCGERKAVQMVMAKACGACLPEWERRRTARWRAANPEKRREWDRRRDRVEYNHARYQRRCAARTAPRLAAAAAEVQRTWIALPVGRELVQIPARATVVCVGGPASPFACVPARRFVAGCCAECGETFVYQHTGGPLHRFCKSLCSKRHHRRQYRGRQRAAFVEPVFRRKVFERDGWRCQLCKRLVSKTAVVPHLRAPTIDHIVPLAEGGDHSMANAQTAHFKCNSEKRELARNDQLRLVG